MSAKKVSPQSILGQLGANLIERIVLQMKYVWRPLQIFDVGVDGDIEICDPATGEATNTIIRVQAKATSKSFHAETDDSFAYTCDQKDLDYWLRGNAPVILIICRPDNNEAYWISVKEYFNELTAQKSRKVIFDKQRNRFDVSTAHQLKQLALPKDSGIYFAPLPKHEKLYSNLIKVASFAPLIYVADTEYRDKKDVWAYFKSKEIKAGSEWILTNKRLISFHSLDEPPFRDICDQGTCESFTSGEWAETDDDDRKRDFVRLLNCCLREKTKLFGLRFDNSDKHKYYYFKATKRLRTRKIQYHSLQNQTSREVFKQYGKKKDATQRAYCRHSAFKGSFLRFNNEWYLEITPTYHFTFDGYRDDHYGAERLSGIKRLERNPAVLGHLLMWADILGKSTKGLFSNEYQFLNFGELVSIDGNIGLPDEIWYNAEEGEEAKLITADENQLALTGFYED